MVNRTFSFQAIGVPGAYVGIAAASRDEAATMLAVMVEAADKRLAIPGHSWPTWTPEPGGEGELAEPCEPGLIFRSWLEVWDAKVAA